MNQGDIDRLLVLGLPKFSNLPTFAQSIRIPVEFLAPLTKNPNAHYRRFWIQKSSGRKRQIAQPNKNLKAIQAWILRNILDRLMPSPYATAYVRERSLSDNVTPHQSNRYFACFDIQDFFPSIKLSRVQRIFTSIGYEEEAALLLSKVCCFRERLPQGGVCSPALSNLACVHLDFELAREAETRGISFTRYADDMTFSSNDPRMLHGLRRFVSERLYYYGFRLNNEKVKYMGPNGHCRVTGLVKSASKPKFSVGRRKMRLIRSVLFRLHANQPVDGDYLSEESVDGWLAFLRQHDSDAHARFLDYIEALKFKAEVRSVCARTDCGNTEPIGVTSMYISDSLSPAPNSIRIPLTSDESSQLGIAEVYFNPSRGGEFAIFRLGNTCQNVRFSEIRSLEQGRQLRNWLCEKLRGLP